MHKVHLCMETHYVTPNVLYCIRTNVLFLNKCIKYIYACPSYNSCFICYIFVNSFIFTINLKRKFFSNKIVLNIPKCLIFLFNQIIFKNVSLGLKKIEKN